MFWTLVIGCGGLREQVEACACEAGHGARVCADEGDCGPCACLPPAPTDADGGFAREYFVDPEGPDGDGSEASPWNELAWNQVDAALAEGPVVVWYARGSRADRELQILRTDQGPNRLVLDGNHWGEGDRASAAGVSTTEQRRKRSRITVRGFDLSDTENQGVFWEAGDGVVLEDLVVHRNGTSPAIYFEYASRSGLPSSDLTIRNSHVYDTTGECIYVGGVENTRAPSHSTVTIERNLVHHCGARKRHGDDWDGINVKDGISGVVLRENVVYEAHWGLQLDSPVTLEGGLVFDVAAAGVMMGGVWRDGYDGARFEDLAVLRPGAEGLYVGADEFDTSGLGLARVTVHGTEVGLTLAGSAGLTGTAESLSLTDCEVAFGGWGEVDVDVTGCNLAQTPDAGLLRATCTRTAPGYGDLSHPEGPDGVYFTEDDPWLSSTGAQLRPPG